MFVRSGRVSPGVLKLVIAALTVLTVSPLELPRESAQGDSISASHGQEAGFEVWIADQSDTRPGYGGQILVYDGAHLHGKDLERGTPITRIDVGENTAALCVASTGRRPVRPHMIQFNTDQTHAVVSFVGSGHVAIFDAETRTPLACMETTIGSTGTRQAHAAFPSPDGSYILVANQNGKRLERIDVDFATNTFVQNAKATLDLATCSTPSGQPCEHPELRPLNWPICPVIDSTSRYAFVTLRGGGLFIVDASATPMTIVGEYDRATVRGNGCGGIEVDGQMYINSGGSPVNVSSGNPHHPDLYGFDVYRFALAELSTSPAPNTPAPSLLLSKTGMSDSHGVAAAGRRADFSGCSIGTPTSRKSSTRGAAAG